MPGRGLSQNYDAETGRFTALDPLREKGGDADFYGYCVDDPVNRVDVWGLEGEEANKDKPYYCWLTGECDEQGRITGSYKPIPGDKESLPFLLDFSVPIPKKVTNWLGIGDKDDPKEYRLPLLPDFEVGPFLDHWKEKEAERTEGKL